MGSALVEGALRAGVCDPTSILVVDNDSAARVRAERLGCKSASDASYASRAARLVLAVKPQSFPELAHHIGELDSPTLVLSVMAGVPMARVRDALGHQARCARCMPNIAARVGLATTTLACGEECTKDDREFATRILSSVGTTIEIPEELFDAATAVNGSGPAYLFLLAEAMTDAAMRMGFDAPTADRLVRQTLMGAATLLAKSSIGPADLRASVTSVGGTTSAALAVLDSHGFRSMMTDALRAARDRGSDLAKDAARTPQGSGSGGVA